MVAKLKSLTLISSSIGMGLLLACAPVADVEPAVETPTPVIAENPPVVEEVVEQPIEEVVLASEPLVQPVYKCSETAKQSGAIFCKLPPETIVSLNGQKVAKVGPEGLVAIGLKQNAPSPAIISWTDQSGKKLQLEIPVEKRNDNIRNLTGLNCDKVDARTPEQKNHAGESWVKKVAAFASLNTPVAKKISFQKPAEGPYSSPFGPTRHYSGDSEVTGKTCKKTSVHRGLDMATPVGTDLIAPMAGTVTLADSDLYYEGGTIFFDHGYGLVSVFMHLSEVSVEAGQIVQAGERLGATGNTGRSTGPHLHWAIKWRNTARDDRKGDFYIDPAIMLELPEWEAMSE